MRAACSSFWEGKCFVKSALFPVAVSMSDPAGMGALYQQK